MTFSPFLKKILSIGLLSSMIICSGNYVFSDDISDEESIVLSTDSSDTSAEDTTLVETSTEGTIVPVEETADTSTEDSVFIVNVTPEETPLTPLPETPSTEPQPENSIVFPTPSLPPAEPLPETNPADLFGVIINSSVEQETTFSKTAEEILKEEQGVDGICFLKNNLLPILKDTAGMTVLDVGCVDGSSSFYMATHGAQKVCVIDDAIHNLTRVQQDAGRYGLADKTEFMIGSVENMPYETETFDMVVALDVASTFQGLNDFLAEVKRVMKYETLAYILIPNSITTVFCQAEHEKSIKENIDQQLAACDSEAEFIALVENMPGLIRGSFNCRNGVWRRIKKENELFFGDWFYYKGPEGVEKIRHHPRSEYMSIFLRDGFSIEQIISPSFGNEEERLAYNESCATPDMQLGTSYIGNSPFILFVLEKS